MDLKQALTRFDELKAQLHAYDYALSLSSWDLSTLAPPKGKAQASKSVGYLSGVAFEIRQSKEMGEVLETLLRYENELDPFQKREVTLFKRGVDKTRKIPQKEFRAYKELEAMAQVVWEEAKNKADYKLFAPYLEKMITYKKKFSKLADPNAHPYDPLLDDFEFGLNIATCDNYFNVVKEKTVPLAQKIAKEGGAVRDDFLYRHYPVKRQKEVSYKLLNALGFDLEGGVMAASEHPYTTHITQGDVRLTTHFYENFLSGAIMSTIHEAGHGIHSQNTLASPIAGNLAIQGGMSGICESQSRFYENIICRDQSFWEFFYPTLLEAYPEQLKDVTMAEFHRAINISRPSFIRIEADELTYHLHIMIRYEIERMIFEDLAGVDELPGLWNKKYEEYLGIIPPDDKLGILQDIHWSGGLFGYFPTYSLGSAYAAQFKYAIAKEMDMAALCRKGNLAPITAWLNKHVHQFGPLKMVDELMQDATGEAFNPLYLTKYLEEKFTALYF